MTASLDAAVAARALRGAAGLLDAARALGTLDVGALSRLLAPLGLASQPQEYAALFERVPRRLGAGPVTGLGPLPWPGPAVLAGDDVLVHGAAAAVDTALRLAAGHLLGMVPALLRYAAEPPPQDGVPLLQLLDSLPDEGAPTWLVLGPPSLVVDLVSPAARDLRPVLQVLARRQGIPVPEGDPAYDALPALLAQEPTLRDERVQNDARAGVFATAGGALVDLGALDLDAVDDRVAAALKNAEGVLVTAEPGLAGPVLARLGHRLRGVLHLCPADGVEGVAVELPARVVDGRSGHVVDGLLQDAAVQGKDIPVPGTGVVVGETALGAPSILLGGAARRAAAEARAVVIGPDACDAIFEVEARRADGRVAPGCRRSVAAFDARRPAFGRSVVAVFLQKLQGPGRPGTSKKVRIRG